MEFPICGPSVVRDSTGVLQLWASCLDSTVVLQLWSSCWDSTVVLQLWSSYWDSTGVFQLWSSCWDSTGVLHLWFSCWDTTVVLQLWSSCWDATVVLQLWSSCWHSTAVLQLWSSCWDSTRVFQLWPPCWDSTGVLHLWSFCWDSNGAFQAVAPSWYLELLDKQQKRICRTVGPSLAASLKLLTHRNVARLSIFYRYFFGRSSSELAQLVPPPYSRGRSTRYLHDFSVIIRRCCKDVCVNSSFPRTARLRNSVPIGCFPLTRDLNGFESRINRHLLT